MAAGEGCASGYAVALDADGSLLCNDTVDGLRGGSLRGGLIVGQAPTPLTTLADPMDDSISVATVVNTDGYPESGVLLIENEAITYTGKSLTTFTGLGRGALGTTAAPHAATVLVDSYLLVAAATPDIQPRMVVTGNGRVGIGIAAPPVNVEVAARQPVVRLRDTTASGSATDTYIEFGGTNGGVWSRTGLVGDASGSQQTIDLWGDAGTSVRLAAGGSERVRVDAGTGRVGIGTAAPAATLDVAGVVRGRQEFRWRADNASVNQKVWRSYVDSATWYLGTMDDAEVTESTGFRVSRSGTAITQYTFQGGCISGTMCSDARLKVGIRPVQESMLDKVARLRPVTFRWQHDASASGAEQMGLIAQEVEQVLPQVVSVPRHESAQRGLSCTGLDAALVKCAATITPPHERQLHLPIEPVLTGVPAVARKWPSHFGTATVGHEAS
ncbi:MAG: tail fiber domain-containing protein, partial [Deltaproteobacteria bacterium]|nr:tail fiber domain-containing protein [Deltaproteobacteria bacterium]